MTINPFHDFVKSVQNPRDALLIFDVDLAIQPSMSTETTPEQRQRMWELFQITDGGVLFFTGRTHQSILKTFDRNYAGVFEHYSVARFGHGQEHTFMAPKLDVGKVAQMSAQGLAGSIRLAETPEDIRANSDLAVFIEVKNASVALVHTLSKSADANEKADHLSRTRYILEPVADRILHAMNLTGTHVRKTGGDAVEIVPKGMDTNSDAKHHLAPAEIKRILQHGLGKDTAVHNFQTLYPNRRAIITGDSEPDLKAMVVGREYDGKGVYVSNGHALHKNYAAAVDHTIDHYTMTWPMIIDASIRMRDAMPKAHPPLPEEGGMTPNLKYLG